LVHKVLGNFDYILRLILISSEKEEKKGRKKWSKRRSEKYQYLPYR